MLSRKANCRSTLRLWGCKLPFAFGVAGLLLITAGVRGQTSNLFSLLKSDFTGPQNYFEWMVAIFLVGSIGYIKQLSTISRLFMIIVGAGLLYQNRNVLSQLTSEEQQATGTSSQSTSTTTTQTASLPSLPSVPDVSSALNELDAFNASN
jgi:hypothetical protein